MLVRLIKTETPEEFAGALADPVKMEDQAIYLTSVPEYARKLGAADLPCIYVEAPVPLPGSRPREEGAAPSAAGNVPEFVYGVDIAVPYDVSGEALSDPQFLLDLWKRHYGLPWEIARTDRLLLRESIPADLPGLLAVYAGEAGNPDVQPLSQEPEEELLAYIGHRYPFYGYGLWSVLELSTGELIGRAGLEETQEGVPEIAWLFAREKRGQGYAREAACAILSYAQRELGFRRVAALISTDNSASRRLAESLGFAENPEKSEKQRKYFEIDLTSRPTEFMIK